MPSLQAILAWLVVFVAVPVNWVVVVGLWRLLRVQRGNRVLRDRFLVAVMLAAVVTLFAAVFLNNDVVPTPFASPFTPEQTMVVTRLAILSLTIPAIYWLTLYKRKPK